MSGGSRCCFHRHRLCGEASRCVHLPRLHITFVSSTVPHLRSLFTLFFFPGGQQWGGVFFAEIQSSCTKVQARKGGLLQLTLPKKVPLLTWPSLLVSSN